MSIELVCGGISEETEDRLRTGPVRGLLKDFLQANDMAIALRERNLSLKRESAALQSDIERHVKIASDLATENAAYLAQIARLDADLDAMRDSFAQHIGGMVALKIDNEALLEQLAEARRDAERLDFFDKNPRSVVFSTGYRGASGSWAWWHNHTAIDAPNLRAAIDSIQAARAKESGNG